MTTHAQAIDQYFSDQLAGGTFSGVVLVAHNDEMILHQAYGMADRERKVPNTDDTRFQIASVGKTITATAIMLLAARGEIDLHDPISTYLPETPKKWQDITVRQLLSHMSGITDYLSLDEFYDETHLTAEGILRGMKKHPLDFDPGSGYAYSNTNFILLGKIIEAVSGKTFAEFLRAHIFDPLGMNSTGRDDKNAPNAVGYSEGAPDDVYDITNALGDGDLWVTTGDLYKFDRALRNDVFLARGWRERMFKPIDDNEYGLGWEAQTWNDKRYVYHNGSVPGFSTEFMRLPDDNAVIIILSNNYEFEAEDAAWDIAAMLFPD